MGRVARRVILACRSERRECHVRRLPIGDLVFASRSGETPIVGYRKLWLRIAALGDLPARITPHVLRHCSASLQ